MKQWARRTIGMLLAAVMLFSLVPVTFADNTANFPDFPTGWSKEAMTAAVNNGLLNGFEDGKIHPEANLTRAQFAAIITRSFGAETKANISAYSDVLAGAWYYDAIAKAVKMGALNGKSSSVMDPDSPITRQEVFTAFARVLVLSDENTSALNKFNDKGQIASWALNHMAALTQRGYVNGDPQGNVNPTDWISREEFAQLMHNAIRTYITEPGTYTDDMEGITVIRVGGVTLKGLTNTSDLVIGDGVGEGNIILENVTIGKRLLVRGAGVVKVSKSTLGDFVVVNNVNGVTKFENYRSESFFKDIVENTKAEFKKGGSGGTSSDFVTVTFYRLYSNNPNFKIGELSIQKGSTVDETSFPDPHTAGPNGTSLIRTGYVEDANIAPVYDGNNYTHSIVPEFWYVKDGVITQFDKNVVINGDTNVYLMTKELSFQLQIEGAGDLGIYAYYNDSTRVMNSVKDMIAISGKQQIEDALANNMIPNYDEMVAKVVGKMESAGVIKVDANGKKNIQIVDVPIKISMLIKEQTIHKMVKQFIRDAVKNPAEFAELYTHVNIRDNANELDVDHTIISSMTDDEIKGYINGLSYGEKQTFADKLFEVVKKDVNYKYFVDSLMNKDTFEINKVNASEIAIIKKSIRELSLEDALAESNNGAVNKLVDVIGIDEFRTYYETMRDNYCDALEDVIEEVLGSSNSNIKKSYTTSLTFEMNIFDIYEKMYDKVENKAIEKLQNAGIYYNDNKYLKFLVEEQDLLEYLFDGDKSLASGDFTGYSLKGVMDYYDYLVMLLIVGDDALTWYGNNEGVVLTEAQLDALYDAMFDKIFLVHEKMNEILVAFKNEGKLPSNLQSVVESVDKLNSLILQYGDKAKSLIEKYLGSSINAKFEDESIAEDKRVIKIFDLLIGKDNPVVSVDTIYAVIYEYDDTVQAKLKQIVESEKFKQAIDKFEATSFGELFKGDGQNSLYNMFYTLAHEGIDAFKVPAGELAITDIDIYRIKVGKVEMTIKRSYK